MPKFRNGKLSEKQKKFIDEYLIDLNAKQAAIRAGYSKKTAEKIGSENLNKPEVSAEIAKRAKKSAHNAGITRDRVLLEIARLAFNDPRKVMDENGDIKPVEDWDDDVAACIASIKTNTHTDKDGGTDFSREVKFWDKGKQLELAGRFLKLFVDKIELPVNVNLGLSPELEAAVKIINERNKNK